tara:strand:+ start:21192 stop:23498 length:2307 start_codon:yes stop_codon:yes gene_type:complete
MALRDLFRKNESPTIVGSPDLKSEESVTKFYLEFPDASGQPIFELDNSLAVGSEEGEALIKHEGIAPKHCSFLLNQGVLSVIDHGGSTGTFINNKKIPTGKMIIMDPKDKIRLGELKCKVVKREEVASSIVEDHAINEEEEASPLKSETEEPAPKEFTPEIPQGEDEEVPAVPDEATASSLNLEESLSNLEEENQEYQEPSPITEAPKKEVAAFADRPTDSSNAVIRIFGMSFDILIVGIIYNLFSNFTEFNDIVEGLPGAIFQMLLPLHELVFVPMLQMAFEFVPALQQIAEAITAFFGGGFSFYFQIAILVMISRFISSIIFGQTLGQTLAGIRAHGEFLPKRFLSIVRSVVGFALLPLFFILDFTTLFSKRSFKEVISFTRLRTPSNLVSLLSIVVFTPVLVTLFFVSPLFRGLETPTPMRVSTLKTVKLAAYTPGDQAVNSKFFKMSYPADQVDYALPNFKFSRRKGRLTLDPTLSFIGKEGEELKLAILKELDLGVFLEDFVMANPLASTRYPAISQLVNDVSNTNKNFKSRIFPQETIVSELQRLTETAFSLGDMSVDSIITTIERSGPFLGSYLDFKDKVIALLGQKPNKLSFGQVGDSLALVATYKQGRMERVKFLPINNKKTRLYQVSYPSNERVDTYQLMAFNSKVDDVSEDRLLAFVDLLTSKELKEQSDLVLGLFQSVYGQYFEMSKLAFERGDDQMQRRVIKSASDVLQLLSKNAKSLGLPEKISDKLSQNLSDLILALKEKDMDFFGISSVGVI